MLDDVKTALITGASRGIGESFARQLAGLGKDLVLVARSTDRLQALADELRAGQGVEIDVITADLTRPDGAAHVFAETKGRGRVVDLLVNNAGFAKAGPFVEISAEVQAEMVRLNVDALAELTRLYLPGMCRRGRGGVINVGSTASFQPVPYLAVYGATKAFVLNFSEAVAEEVRADGVKVMALCPGATNTEFWTTAGVWEERRNRMCPPDRVVAQALRAFDRGRTCFVPGGMNRLMAFAARLAPRHLVTHFAARTVGAKR